MAGETLLTEGEIAKLMPERPAQGHKGMFGRLLCVVGSRRMPGAAMLAVNAALRCGVGTLCVASQEDVCRLAVSRTPEAMTLPLQTDGEGFLTAEAAAEILCYAESCTAVLVGCGLGQSEGARNLVRMLVPRLSCPMVLDADGLNAVADRMEVLKNRRAPAILTPHPGEMGRLLHIPTEQVQSDRLGAARKLLSMLDEGDVVVLKGPGTVIVSGERANICYNGNSGMSKGGSGDVLAGMTASFLAQHIPAPAAARIGVFLHGLAGDRAAERLSRRGMLPSDLIEEIPGLLKEYET